MTGRYPQGLMWIEELQKLSDEELQQYRANTHTTGCMALDHMKGDMNGVRRNRCDDELKSRGLEIDKSIKGIFNGKGSW